MLKLVIIGALGLGAFVSQEPATQQSRQAPSGPYGQLFEVDRADFARLRVTPQPFATAPRSSNSKEVVPSTHPSFERGGCNMPIIPANASVDRGMLILKPESGPEPKIRVIEPKACWKK